MRALGALYVNLSLLQDNYFISFVKNRVNYLKSDAEKNEKDRSKENENEKAKENVNEKDSKNTNNANNKHKDNNNKITNKNKEKVYNEKNIKINIEKSNNKNIKTINITIKKNNNEYKKTNIFLTTLDIITAFWLFNLILYLLNQEDYNLLVLSIYYLTLFILMMKV